MEQIDHEFEYNKKDLIGHGAFAVVYKGRFKHVSENSKYFPSANEEV